MKTRLAAKALMWAALGSLWLPAAAAEGDPARGRELAYSCLGCHGIENYKNAYPKYSVPKLAGQNETYLIAALAQYQAKARWHPTMQGISTTLGEQDFADLAAYFSGAHAVEPAAAVGTPPAAAQTCAACHGQTGIGTLPENPTIAGQHADYLAQALNDYRLGRRQNAVMNGFAGQLSRQDIAALAAYFSAQRGLATASR